MLSGTSNRPKLGGAHGPRHLGRSICKRLRYQASVDFVKETIFILLHIALRTSNLHISIDQPVDRHLVGNQTSWLVRMQHSICNFEPEWKPRAMKVMEQPFYDTLPCASLIPFAGCSNSSFGNDVRCIAHGTRASHSVEEECITPSQRTD
jgi:hypothetical protein